MDTYVNTLHFYNILSGNQTQSELIISKIQYR